MTKLGKLWTGAVAYVSLLVGAGLSVAGNLADTYRIRGSAVDAVDIVLAVGPPIATLLVAELFVSEWPRTWSVQSVRWVAMAVVGTLATVVSWLHINELLMARGQLLLVAILWPIAIDGLAIMAMAKILVMRGHRHADTPSSVRLDVSGVTISDTDMDRMATKLEGLGWSSGTLSGRFDSADSVATPDADMSGLMGWVSGQERAHADIGEQLATEAERYLSADTPLPRRTRTASGTSVPQEFADMVAAWEPAAIDRADVVKLAATHFGVSTRTARRWLARVLNEPVSGAGAE